MVYYRQNLFFTAETLRAQREIMISLFWN